MKQNYILGFLLAASLIGCSKKEAASSQPTATTPPAVPSQPDKMPDAPPMAADLSSNMASNASASVASAQTTITNAMNNAQATMTNAVNNLQVSSLTNNSTASKAMNLAGGLFNPSTPTVAPVDSAAPMTPAPAASSSSSLGSLSLADLTTDQATKGLKEALGKGLQHAVASLGQPGGFLTNLSVKIPLPEKLQPVEKTLRALGQGAEVDQCITTMNQAAEQAVPAATDVFVGTLQNLSVTDAKAILSGPQDAATQYFRRSTESQLTQKFQPIVQQAMTKCGATAAYEQVLGKASAATPFFSKPSFDLNSYVTQKAMDGLFKMVADEEKKIRENPMARSTDLLKSVFGAIQK